MREIKWLSDQHGIKSIVTITKKPLPSKLFKRKNIDSFHLSVEDYGAPSVEELDHVVDYIKSQIDNQKPVLVHCSGGNGRTGTILAAYLIKKETGLSAEKAIYRLRNFRGESIQSEDQKTTILNYEGYLKTKEMV